jgi:hypothetical protein
VLGNLTKFSGPGSIFVNEVAFLVKQPKIDNLTSGDLFLTSDSIDVIDFFSRLINAHMHTKFGENRTMS